MERWPTDSSASFSHAGEGPTFTPLITAPTNRRHFVESAISTEIPNERPRRSFIGRKSRKGSDLSGTFKIAESSFAMPRWLKQSAALFGKTFTSNTASCGLTISTLSISNAWKVSASASFSALGSGFSKYLCNHRTDIFMILYFSAFVPRLSALCQIHTRSGYPLNGRDARPKSRTSP